MRIAVVADTHVPSRAKSIPASAWRRIAGCDLILHAGDVCAASLLDELAELAPVHVAAGNMDPPEVRAWGALDDVVLDLEGVRVAMTHDAGISEGRARRMRERFPGSNVVVFGHSHLPLIEWGAGVMLLNPGSPTDRRRAPFHTLALLRLEDGRPWADLVQLD